MDGMRAPPFLLAALIANLALTAPSDARGQTASCEGGVEALAWMAGTWRGSANGVAMEETWMAPAGGLLVGMHRDVFGPDRAFFEFLRIEEEDGEVVYRASPRGAPPTPFRLVACGSRKAVFENPEHDYPQRIVYAREGDRLTARIEGVDDEGRERSSEWRWTHEEGATP